MMHENTARRYKTSMVSPGIAQTVVKVAKEKGKPFTCTRRIARKGQASNRPRDARI